MKKVICLIIALVLVLGSVHVLAESNGELVLQEELFDRIEEVCESEGCTVFRNDVSIGVQKGTLGFAVMNDTVTYMDNGMIVNESLYVDGVYVKMPEKAILSVLGKDYKKSAAYRKVLESFQTKLSYGRYTQKTIDTDYGTIVVWGSGGHMRATSDEITYIRYDGESVHITNDMVPYINTWMPCEYSSIEISNDGKTATITYPEIEETVVFSPGVENRTLREKGQMIVTIDLENCTVDYKNHPLKTEEYKKEEKASAAGYMQSFFPGSVKEIYMLNAPKNPYPYEFMNMYLSVEGDIVRVEKAEDLVIYSDSKAVENYAKRIGVKFEYAE